MLPIYQAILAEEKDLSGGTTRPLLATVVTDNGLDKYVVKIFPDDEQPNYAPLFNEVYGSLLATQFDIRTPEIALIKLEPDFIHTLKDDIKARVLSNNIHLYFGSRYYDGYNQYVPPKFSKTFDIGHLETIFAFDVLIRNVDRRVGKSNLLVKKGDYLAIDHELAFSMNKNFDQYQPDDWSFINRHRTHIFRSRLHRLGKDANFAVIQEYMRALDLNILFDSANFLHNLGLPVGNIQTINSYLRSAKNNCPNFINLCKYLIA